MKSPTGRDISTPEQRRALRNLFQSMILAELLVPSDPLWLFSAWISDIVIVDNSARQFLAICPDWEAREIRLSECLEGVCNRGGRVVLVLRKVDHNNAFIATIKKTSNWHSGRIGIVITEEQHVKAMVGEHFLVDGSMNYTHNGITISGEKISYRVEETAVQEELIKLNEYWRGRIQWGPNG